MTLQSTNTSTMTSMSSMPLPIIRLRSRTGMKDIRSHGTAVLFAAGDARHDRIKARYTARVLVDPASMPDMLSEIGPPDDEGLFVGTVQPNGLTMRLRSRRDASRRPMWLVTGRGIVKCRPEPGFIDIDMELDLNPTRFLAHQPDPSPAAILERDPFEALRVNASKRVQLALATLDGGDNVLIGLDRLGGERFEDRATQWQHLLTAYLTHLRLALHATIRPQHIETALIEDKLTLTQVETYYEFSAADAVSTVGDLSRLLMSADGASRLFRRAEIGGTSNARWMKLPLTADIDAKVYAKTHDRVRVEITYTSRVEQAAERAGVARTGSTIAKLMTLNTDAARRLETFWDALMTLDALDASATDVCEFMARLNRAVPEGNRRLMLSLIANNRGVTATAKEGFAPPAVCRALVREGILTPARARQHAEARFALTPAWSGMFDRLLDRADASPPRAFH
jgi:hypothetical protein